MEVKLVSKEGQSIVLDLEGADYSVADIIRHELLKNENVVFAGVVSPHPLLNKVTLRVEIKGDPGKALADSGEKAKKTVKALLDEIIRALGRK